MVWSMWCCESKSLVTQAFKKGTISYQNQRKVALVTNQKLIIA